MATKKTVKVKKIDGLTPDIQQEKIDALKKLVPEAFSDGKIDAKKLEKLLGSGSVAEDERYRLDWAGKSEVFDEIAKRTSCTLTLDEKRSSKDWEKSKNVFIEGENMEVLRTLQKAYHGKVKMIYIDPPYNTGKDFVYNDNFRETEEEYCDDACNIDESGDIKKAYKLNTRDNGRFHSSWLSMMYPRLYLARNLLRDDGVIFISIDDNEASNLQNISNEIFGEENFVAKIIWKKRTSPDARTVVGYVHDYILCYCKNVSTATRAISKMELSDTRKAAFSNPDNDERGVWSSVDMTGQTGRAPKTQYYDITLPSGRITGPPKGRAWGVSLKTFKEMREDNRIWFGATGDGAPRMKRFLSESDGQVVPTFWDIPDVGSNDEANKEVRDLFGGINYFDNPKPVRLLKRIVDISTGENDVCLDFFSGSGSTAHAVMSQNAEDGKNRQYLCVQIPEKTPEGSEAKKAGYEKISNIAIDRIKKSATKIKKEHPGFKGDLGLRVYTETDSHFPQWHSQAFESDEALKQAMMDYSKEETVGSERDRATEVLLKLGYPLTTELTEKVGCFFVNGEIALVLDSKFKVKDLQKVLDEAPKTIVVLEKLFKKDDEKINFGLRCRETGVILQTV